MKDLRKAAEMALDVLLDPKTRADEVAEAVKVIRQALDLQTAIEKGTKAWADVSNATEWVEDLRGNTPDCKTHPDAPHGFDRNASHSADRYVCECEGWEPVDKVDMSEKRVHKTDKSIHELDLEAPLTINGVPLYPKREWVGLTADEIWKCNKAQTGSAVEFHICSAHQNVMDFAEAIEAKLKDKNGG